MSALIAHDELSTLLDLMADQCELYKLPGDTPKNPQLLAQKSRFYNLLNGWSKRTSVADQQ